MGVDHRSHAEIENPIRDLKHGVGLNHPPSGHFPANAAWLAVQVMAHNLARWTAPIGMGDTVIITKTLRRRFYALAGRITLHLPRAGPSKIVRTADPVSTPPAAFGLSSMMPNAWAISTQVGPLTVSAGDLR